MAIRNIIQFDDAFLSKKSRDVVVFDKRLWQLLDDMAQTMYAAEGVGLAAPQVGILRKAVVIDVGDGLVELINPVITEKEGVQVGAEGCLSYPGESGLVERPFMVKVSAYDRNGKRITLTAEALFARAVCHEIDHLNGVVFKNVAQRMLAPDEIK